LVVGKRYWRLKGDILKSELLVKHRKPELFEGDIPEERLKHYLTKKVVAIDTETRGLILRRDRLCLVQICDEDGVVSFVRYGDVKDMHPEAMSNVKKLCHDPNVVKIFHYGRFDVSVLKYYLGIDVNPLFCTKIASKLVRTYTDRHSLKDLVRELLGVELDKSDQTSDWAQPNLTDSQLEYAANDVRVLLPIYDKIKELLVRENRLDLHTRLCQALPTVCELDAMGFNNIFEH
jgi:ribonuclease D